MEKFEKMESINQLFNNVSMKPEIKYKRPKLVKICKTEEDVERGYLHGEEVEKIYNQISSDYNMGNLIQNSISPSQLEFYFFNCESIEDSGWGCAWRSIQILVGTARNLMLNEDFFQDFLPYYPNLINIENRFDSMFNTYGSKEKLLEIFMDKNALNQVPEFLLLKEFAPFETENGWAEPFIAQLILHDLGLHGELFLVNEYKKSAYAPAQVFDKVISYEEFIVFLLKHFAQKYPLPIMIDDSFLSMTIIGVEKCKNSNHLNLLIADPHVYDLSKAENGIYHVTLDEKGNFENKLNPVSYTHLTLPTKRIV